MADNCSFLHTMIRVGDLDRSLRFYTELLGMKELRRRDVPDGKYTLVFVGYGRSERRRGDRADLQLRRGRLRHGHRASATSRSACRTSPPPASSCARPAARSPASRAGEVRHHGHRLRRGPGRLQDRADPAWLTRAMPLMPGWPARGRWCRCARTRAHRRHRAGAGGQDGAADLDRRQPAGRRRRAAAPAGAGRAAGRARPAGGGGARRARTRCRASTIARHLAALAARPAGWPARTEAVSLLALDWTIGRPGSLVGAAAAAAAAGTAGLSRRMAARPAAARQRLRRVVGEHAAPAREAPRGARRSWPSCARCRRRRRPTRRWRARGTLLYRALLRGCARPAGCRCCSPAAS